MRVLALLGCLVACEEAPTQLVVVVATDLDVPAELDGLGTRVARAGREPRDERRFTLRVEGGAAGATFASLPASFGVAPRDGDPHTRVQVTAGAWLGDQLLFETRAVTSFIEDRRLRLDLFLAERCIEEHVACDADETCTIEGCVPAFVDPGTLPEYDGLDAAVPDAAPPSPDAATDAGDAGGAGDAGDAGDGGAPPRAFAGLIAEADGVLPMLLLRAGQDDLYVVAELDQLLQVAGIGDFVPLGAGSHDLLLGRWSLDLAPEQVSQLGAPGAVVSVLSAALDDAEGLLVAGEYVGAPDLGGGPLPDSGAPASAAFAARFLGADLTLDWAWTAVSNDVARVMTVAPGADGEVAIGGQFTGTVDLGDLETGTLVGFVAVLDGVGHDVACHVAIGGATSSVVTGVGWRTDGVLFASGFFDDTADLGDGVPRAPLAGDQRAGFLARYPAACTLGDAVIASGLVLDARAAPAPDGQSLVLVGETVDDVTLGDQVMPRIFQQDLWSVGLDAALAPTGSASMGGRGRDELADVAARAGVPPLIAGWYRADAAFGDLALTPVGMDGFVAALDADGVPTWAVSLGGDDDDAAFSVSWHTRSPLVYVLGTLGASATLGPTLLEPTRAAGVYVYGFEPPGG